MAILRHLISLVWNLFMENRILKNFLVGLILFLMGAGVAWAFTWLMKLPSLSKALA